MKALAQRPDCLARTGRETEPNCVHLRNAARMLLHALWTQRVRYALSRDVGVDFVVLFLNYTHIFSFLPVVTAEDSWKFSDRRRFISKITTRHCGLKSPCFSPIPRACRIRRSSEPPPTDNANLRTPCVIHAQAQNGTCHHPSPEPANATGCCNERGHTPND